MNTQNSLQTISSTNSALQARYGTFENLLLTFNPGMQRKYCANTERCFFGTAPTLRQINEAYGKNSATACIIPHLYDISEYSGCRDKLNSRQYMELSQIISMEYHYLKITELMLFCYRFKAGRYGKFYGAVDPLVITCSLRDFIVERGVAISRYEQEQRELREAEIRKNAITYDQYLQMKKEREDKRL